ncbi:DUF3800 domain-containing protein [Clostridium botulinum]|nr:DUF3800 domain-containing protein [Clostridium botulinum]
MKIKFFCDESGNTGRNFLDEKDPFFVLGGWLDKCNNSSNIELINEIECIFESKEKEEIKSVKLIKSAKGRRKIKSLIECMIKYGYIPFFAIVHKRFAIAARVVDVLLDPEYNNMVSRKITYNEDKFPIKKYAEIISKLSDYTLNTFAKGYRELNYRVVCESIELISRELRETIKDFQLSNKIFNSKNLISNNLNDERNLEKNQAPNIFSLYTLFYILDNYANDRQLSIDFMHDEQKEFKANMQSMESTLLKERNDTIRYEFNQRQVFFKSIKSLEFKDSKSNIFIQCADITVGAINYILKKLIFNKNLDRIDKELFEILRPYITQFTNPQLTHFMIAEETFKKMFIYDRKSF